MNIKQFFTITFGVLFPAWLGTLCYTAAKYPKDPPVWVMVVVMGPIILAVLSAWFVGVYTIYKDNEDR